MPSLFLNDRSLLRVSGADASAFLQNLITTDLGTLGTNEARPGALLTPQGKILFDFMIWKDGDGFLLETDASQADGLLKRLVMYRLRAPIEIAGLETHGVTVSWGDAAGFGVKDTRFERAGVTLTRLPGDKTEDAAKARDDDYRALRIASGVAVSGTDFPLSDAFPHDVLMDLNGGLSFRKGCYVGQEVVSRMQHRGTARRRVAIVSANGELPATGAVLSTGGKPIGTLGSVVGHQGLAIVRIDRAGEAMAAGQQILVGDVPVSLALPAWSGLSFPTTADEATA